MARDTLTCEICADPNRYAVEQAYLESGSGAGTQYTRQQIERHMSHIADPRALRLVTDLTDASAVAGRLRALETMAVQIMDAALQSNLIDGVVHPPDLKVALTALREARQTIVEMGRITETLQSRHSDEEERPDLDDAIAAYLAGRAIDDEPVEDSRTAAHAYDDYAPRALDPGPDPGPPLPND